MDDKQKGTIREYQLLFRLQRALTAQFLFRDRCASCTTTGSIMCKQRDVERKQTYFVVESNTNNFKANKYVKYLFNDIIKHLVLLKLSKKV